MRIRTLARLVLGHFLVLCGVYILVHRPYEPEYVTAAVVNLSAGFVLSLCAAATGWKEIWQ